MAKKIAVVLSGCGFKDGSEITEAISALIHLSEFGVEYKIFAPDQDFLSINHLNGQSQGNRNILVESARLSRGDSSPLSMLDPNSFDGLVLPGGYGAATHLCSFAKDGAKGVVLPEIQKIISDFHAQSKPICAMCIAPALLALALKGKGVSLTIGEDPATSSEIEKTGNFHEVCSVTDYVSDRENKVITTPAYMYEAKPHQVFQGIRGAIRELVDMS